MGLRKWFRKQFACPTCGRWDRSTAGYCSHHDCPKQAWLGLCAQSRACDPAVGRRRLPHRRMSIRDKLYYKDSRGSDHVAEVSFGFDAHGVIREVFCIAHKDGTDMQGLVHDACIAVSIALQRGARIGDLADSFGELRNEGDLQGKPASVIGALARAGVALEAELGDGTP